jgi:fission process protein 1
MMNAPKAAEDDGEVDLYRDTNVRYLGYANEVGESFRFIFP